MNCYSFLHRVGLQRLCIADASMLDESLACDLLIIATCYLRALYQIDDLYLVEVANSPEHMGSSESSRLLLSEEQLQLSFPYDCRMTGLRAQPKKLLKFLREHADAYAARFAPAVQIVPQPEEPPLPVPTISAEVREELSCVEIARTALPTLVESAMEERRGLHKPTKHFWFHILRAWARSAWQVRLLHTTRAQLHTALESLWGWSILSGKRALQIVECLETPQSVLIRFAIPVVA